MRTVLLKKNPPLATGPSQGGNAGNVSRFAAALCVVIHTSGMKRLQRWCAWVLRAVMVRSIGASGRALRVTVAAVDAVRGWRFLQC